MKTQVYTSLSRGHRNHGWLDTHHTFSFANYYNPDRMHFGALRVFNDDIVLGGEGFGMHPHNDMEIITIPLYGALEHKDSLGHHGIIGAGEVQVMSAGTGIRHSEFNANGALPVSLLQIWVIPNKRSVEPRYQQMRVELLDDRNRLIPVVTPDPKEKNALWIHQDAWLSLGSFDLGKELKYKLKHPGNGVFAMVIDGSFTVADQKLALRDAVGVWDSNVIPLKADTDGARILLIEVPMME